MIQSGGLSAAETFALAIDLHRRKQWPEARAAYEAVVALKPDAVEAHTNLGAVFRALGDLETAIACYDQAIIINPLAAPAFANRGNARFDLKRFDEALADFDRALALAPGVAENHFNKGNALRELDRLEEAIACYDQAIALHPDHGKAVWRQNRGSARIGLLRYADALADFDAALALAPDGAAHHYNRGNALQGLGRFEEAIASFDQAIALEPDHSKAHWNRGLALLLNGDFERGWPAFEWRWHHTAGIRQTFEAPLWTGAEPLVGKTIILHSEQGLGDTLQFCRYATLVAERGAKVVLISPSPLTKLMSRLEGASVVALRRDVLPTYDFHCPLMSLPLAFGTRLDTIPARQSYLSADPDKVTTWRSLLGAQSRPRVGLVWAGGFRPNSPELWGVNNRRNIPLEALSILRDAKVDFFSLQKGEPAESDLTRLVAGGWGGPPIADLTNRLADFDDTAALVENLDLVIAVDTSTAHLAAALGKPVWLLNRYDTCWRWLLDRDDSPWYPSLRQFRQETPGDWTGVMGRVAAALADWSS